MRFLGVAATLSATHLALAAAANSSSTLFNGGTIVAFDREKEALRVIRNGAVLVEGNRITGVFDAPQANNTGGVDVVDITGKILTTGFIDTHRHGWQTAFKTLASNTSLVEYFGRYGEYVTGQFWTADDVYISQLAGLYEALNAGVTTTLDHAHHTWSNATAEAGLRASIDSGARVFWAYAFHDVPNVTTVAEQLPHFRDLFKKGDFRGTPTSLAIAYDAWAPGPQAEAIIALAREVNISVVTAHSVLGPWAIQGGTTPELLHSLGFLNTSTPIVLSHASFLTAPSAALLRDTDQYVSITPESEMHYGHGHPTSYFFQDQAALGVDTHFTYSTDVLTQARLWLQQTRLTLYSQVLDRWELPANNPESAAQAFLLATRHGGLALRRDDLGVLAPGARADLVVWDGTSPALLGWRDPVAAVILHASVGDIESVMVDGKFVKRGGKLVVPGYDDVKTRFLKTVDRIQGIWESLPLPDPGTEFRGAPVGRAYQADTLRGPGDGYGEVFLK